MKKRVFNARIFCFIFILFSLLGSLYIRGTRNAIMVCNYDADIELNESISGIKGYESTDGKSFLVTEMDPYLLLEFTSLNDSVMRGLIIELNSEIDLSSVQVYYGKNTADFSEAHSDVMSGRDKIIEVNSQKAFEGFKYLRLDVDVDFCIENIRGMTNYEVIYSDKLYKYVCMVFINMFISVIISFCSKIVALSECCFSRMKLFCRFLLRKRRKIFFGIIAMFAIFGTVFLCDYIYQKNDGNNYINIYRVLIFSCILTIVVFVILCRNISLQYIYIYYFFLIMVIGTVTILVIPPSMGMSWDDYIHYSRTANLSWGMKGMISHADAELVLSHSADLIQNGEIYNHGVRKKWQNDFNLKAKENPFLEREPVDGGKVGISYPAYIPGSIGLIIGRGMGLNFITTFRLGKWMNLLYYALLFSLSIKLIENRGKILIAVIGMIPTSLYLASAYAYDCWVIGFTVLGYALCIREIQLYNKIRSRQLIKILFIMIIGFLPKAVYFPLLFPLIIFSPNKNKDNRNNQIMVISAMIILLASFMLPILLKGAGTGDYRGGAGVNSTEQIRFILNSPLQYTRILLGFLKTYLSPDNAGGYLTNLSYYGKAEYYSLCLLIIGVAAILDNVGMGQNYPSTGTNNMERRLCQKIVVTFSCFVSIVLVATALYISFTPVAENTILGCQYRYILPVMFPFLYFIGKIDIEVNEKVRRKTFLLTTLIMAFIFLDGIYKLHVYAF